MPGAMRFAGTQRHLQGLTTRPSSGLNTVCRRRHRGLTRGSAGPPQGHRRPPSPAGRDRENPPL